MGMIKEIKRSIRRRLGLALDYGSEIDCPGRELLGTGYGGWCICPEKISPGSVLYSLGVGDDISFDLAMIEKYQVSVYAFDPTPDSIEWVRTQSLPEHFHFHGMGIAAYDGPAMLYHQAGSGRKSHSVLARTRSGSRGVEVSFRRLSTVMDMLGHSKIDILKMDIEGAEYEVIDDFLSSGIEVGQLLVEFHHKKFRDISVSHTKKSIEKLRKSGYRIFYTSPRQREFSFVRA